MTTFDPNVIPSLHLLYHHHNSDKAEDINPCYDCCLIIPVEGSGLAALAAVSALLIPKAAIPLAGIAIGVFTTQLVLKGADRYDNESFIKITKAVCKLNKKYPNLQIVLVVIVVVATVFNPIAGLITGIAAGCYNAFVLDIEGHKLLQKDNG